MYTNANICKQDNLKLAYQRLITNPESTYKNYFRDTYSAYGLALDDNINLLFKKLKAGYLPTPSIHAFLPKSNGLCRLYTLLSIEDQIVYQAYANIIAVALSADSHVNKRYGKSVFGNLFTNATDRFFYQPWQSSYKAYTSAVIRSYNLGKEFIASFDLTACYDSINHRLLESLLVKKYHFSERCAQEFTHLLQQWESVSSVSLATGIPQGPQASGIIAEIVLTQYDEYIEQLKSKYKFDYFRYVDDIRILASDEQTVRWILFLLDKKSKELGLFPQSSKVAVHKITNIDDEVKRISKPLFDDEFDVSTKSKIAAQEIQKMLRKDAPDLTTIKRYFHSVKHDSYSNKLAIAMVTRFPNTVHSFAYYVLRYPRKIPTSLSNYIYSCCNDKTQQFAAGILLEAVVDNLTEKDTKRFVALAKTFLKEHRQAPFIVDCRFKSQLIFLILKHGHPDRGYFTRTIRKENWWVVSKLFFQLSHDPIPHIITDATLKNCLTTPISCDSGIAATNYIITVAPDFSLPSNHELNPYVQNILKHVGLIQRNRYSTSQINHYFKALTGLSLKFSWKRNLGKEHDPVERNFYLCLGYWQTDLTAFVNLWDTIDDRICNIIVAKHPELGGYSLGKIGAIENSTNFIAHLPAFHRMCMSIHKLRLSSNLSHSEIRRTHQYTGPIPQKKRATILKLIRDGFIELTAFW